MRFGLSRFDKYPQEYLTGITMVPCFASFSDIDEDSQCYQCSEMGLEIISTIQNALSQEVDENDTMCEHCFANIMQMMCTASCDTPFIQEEYELQHPHDVNVCVWCRSSLFMRRTHSLTHHGCPKPKPSKGHFFFNTFYKINISKFFCYVYCKNNLISILNLFFGGRRDNG